MNDIKGALNLPKKAKAPKQREELLEVSQKNEFTAINIEL